MIDEWWCDDSSFFFAYIRSTPSPTPTSLFESLRFLTSLRWQQWYCWCYLHVVAFGAATQLHGWCSLKLVSSQHMKVTLQLCSPSVGCTHANLYRVHRRTQRDSMCFERNQNITGTSTPQRPSADLAIVCIASVNSTTLKVRRNSRILFLHCSGERHRDSYN